MVTKQEGDYRNYADPARDTVAAFYRDNHRGQTLAFVTTQRERFLSAPRDFRLMTVAQAITYLDALIDDSDPDTSLSQRQHLLQAAESTRAEGAPEWFVVTALIHDLGKILCLFGEPQWAVVGDTFPVGCPFSDQVVYPEFFAANPDSSDSRYNRGTGIYEPGCGLRNVMMSWGHDEYLYHHVKQLLPEPALYMIRYHSFYAWHEAGAYDELLDDHDREMLPWVRAFNPHDLYSKTPIAPDWAALQEYYDDLLLRWFPEPIRWAIG